MCVLWPHSAYKLLLIKFISFLIINSSKYAYNFMIFANIMQDKKHLNKFWKKALRKYRFVIMASDSFEEKTSIKLSLLNIFAFCGFLVFFLFFGTVLILTYSGLNTYMPGKTTVDVQNKLIELTITSDSLINKLKSQELYLQNIRNIISGGELFSPETSLNNKSTYDEISFKKSNEDSLLRAVVESEEKGMLFNNSEIYSEALIFFTPIKGVVIDEFNPKTHHFGVDLVAREKTKIYSVLKGVVVISHWTPETGYVIGIQHKEGYFSLYKHNSVLLKSVGDNVSAGSHIAIIGNTGELSSGPHLHFELWKEGVPVNPENYISF